MNWAWTNLDFSASARLRKHRLLTRILRALGFVSDLRWRRLGDVDPEIIAWDLSRGIPFPDQTFDVVYHAHFLEHLPREAAPVFLSECRRVLKPGAMLRVVVPDLELQATSYVRSLKAVENGDPNAGIQHQQAVHELFDYIVRTEITGTAEEQRGWRRWLERKIRGDAADAGELHRWMYDRFSLSDLLESVGFRQVGQTSAIASRIPGWESFHLDAGEDGSEYRPESIYLEAES
jgi:SAM-dependent methyltransferase